MAVPAAEVYRGRGCEERGGDIDAILILLDSPGALTGLDPTRTLIGLCAALVTLQVRLDLALESGYRTRRWRTAIVGRRWRRYLSTLVLERTWSLCLAVRCQNHPWRPQPAARSGMLSSQLPARSRTTRRRQPR